MSATLVIRGARVVTLGEGARPRRGAELGELGVVPNADVVVEGATIARITPAGAGGDAKHVIEAHGRALLPGFIDCHTHACWVGDRLDEWAERLRGVPYLEILARGGGIMSTVRAVRAADEAELARALRARLDAMLAMGTTTVEVKSGYGLSADAELKMLRAIRRAAEGWPGTVVATALLGHAIDPDAPDFVDRTIGATLDAVHGAWLDVAVDAFCENGAWSVADTARLLTRARALGHPVRVHADQFTSQGMVEAAIALGALSVDHLEASGDATRRALAASATIGVLLPVCGFHLGDGYADGGALVRVGAAVAIATNWNPGSAPSGSMPFAMSLAVRHNGLTPAQAIAAGTVNAAAVLRFADRGTIAAGQRADLVLLRGTDERMLAYEAGGDPVAAVVAGGRVVRSEG